MIEVILDFMEFFCVCGDDDVSSANFEMDESNDGILSANQQMPTHDT